MYNWPIQCFLHSRLDIFSMSKKERKLENNVMIQTFCFRFVIPCFIQKQ